MSIGDVVGSGFLVLIVLSQSDRYWLWRMKRLLDKADREGIADEFKKNREMFSRGLYGQVVYWPETKYMWLYRHYRIVFDDTLRAAKQETAFNA